MALTEDGIANAAAALTNAIITAQVAVNGLANIYTSNVDSFVFDIYRKCRAEVVDRQKFDEKEAEEAQRKSTDEWLSREDKW